MSDTVEARLLALEELAAHQAETIEDLSAQLAQQWRLIERLQQRFGDMADRFEDIEDQTRAAQPTQKPPHW
ncbi:SlyX family protein [Pseudohoeflea coraliihabitans]|uniref:Protein SlyX homolog n=1 Tax=Pseudohoeflea coraliihabitans TaxID=2860393 RepID=A0ABS6WPB2_9HYPH|nr:SlyX family protein [Pseudohoeflea sp. DP4N28-3]MBW3097804.1 SlyX family protein [Pseudohoeflea sp. DP4N28-3]